MLKQHPYDVVTTCLTPHGLLGLEIVLCIVVVWGFFPHIPKLNLGLLHAVSWVRNNPGYLIMAKEGCPDTLVHRCSFLAKNRENCNIILSYAEQTEAGMLPQSQASS